MNEGWLAIGVILATIGAGIVLVMYRDLIFTTDTPTPRKQRRPIKRRPGRSAARSSDAETPAKQVAMVSPPVSPIAMPDSDSEMIVFRAIAKLVRAGLITETLAIEHTFDVKAGSSKAYKTCHANLKRALSELDSLN